MLVIGSAPGGASAQTLAVGDRVTVGSTNEKGVVLSVTPLPNGSQMVKVHLDRLGDAFPTVGASYDAQLSHVTKDSAPAPRAQALGVTRPLAGPAVRPPLPVIPTAGPAAIQGQAVDIASQTRISADLCKTLIRANYPAGGDYTQTVSFLTFQMGALAPYEDIAANSVAGLLAHGRTVQAAPVHAKFTVLTHYQDPNADDQLRTYDAQYQCFKSPAQGWTIKMVSRLPGGETAQYIKKR